jgi:hypothetical protein
MNPEHSPFRTAWWSVELPEHRACDSTYCLFPYDSLPPLDPGLFRGEFQWLSPLDAQLENQMAIHRPPEEETIRMGPRLEQLAAAAARLGLKLPAAFLNFMGSPHLLNQIPSCTACYFDLSERIVQLPIDDGGYLIRFLNDQQQVLLWYLYLTPQGESCVVVTPLMFDRENLEGVPAKAIQANIDYCAPSFEEFIYRFWLENDLWFALEGGRPLSDAHTRYLRHYEP